jgi:hypothetical protein
MDEQFMVFDVEAIGLHGEGFAVGYVVIDRDGTRYAERQFACPPEAAEGSDEGRAWVMQNVRPMHAEYQTPRQVRDEFWQAWMRWKAARPLRLVSDCAWPVETRFLSDCIRDDSTRSWHGPYPLLDVSSVLLSRGYDPAATYWRDADEYPIHSPLADARQSARLFSAVLRNLPL